MGIDIGTSGAKAVVVDASGVVRGSATEGYALTATGRGVAEQDPSTYWEAICAVARRAVAAAGAGAASVAAVGISALSPVVVMLDGDGRALGNAPIWMDRRGTAQADDARRALGEEAVTRKSGNVIDPFYGLIKWMWLRDNRPEDYARCRCVTSAAGYVVHRLTGAHALDTTNACLFGIAFDMSARQWDGDALSALGLDQQLLPPLVEPRTVVGEVHGAAAEACGLQPGTPVIAGCVDGSAVCAGSGTLRRGDAVIFLGSSACLFVVAEGERRPRGLINIVHPCPPHDRPSLYTAVGAMVSGGSMLKYVHDLLHPEADAYASLLEAAEAVPAGAEGLLILPYLMGERTPIWNPRAQAVAYGMRADHGQGHWARAAMEAVAYGLRHNLDALREAAVEIAEPVGIAEGGARSALWRQIVADVLGLRLRYRGAGGGAPLGAALLAGLATGVYDREVLERLRDDGGEETAPDRGRAGVYGEGYARYRKLYEALSPYDELT